MYFLFLMIFLVFSIIQLILLEKYSIEYIQHTKYVNQLLILSGFRSTVGYWLSFWRVKNQILTIQEVFTPNIIHRATVMIDQTFSVLDLMVSSRLWNNKRLKMHLPERLMPWSINNQHARNPHILSIKLEKVGKVGSLRKPKSFKFLYKTITLPMVT